MTNVFPIALTLYVLGFMANGNPLEFIRVRKRGSLSLFGSGQGKLEFIRLVFKTVLPTAVRVYIL